MGHWIIIIYVAQDREEAANAVTVTNGTGMSP